MAWDGIRRRESDKENDNSRDLLVETHTILVGLKEELPKSFLAVKQEIAANTIEIESVAKRVSELEGWRRWVNGAGATVAFLLTSLLAVWKALWASPHRGP